MKTIGACCNTVSEVQWINPILAVVIKTLGKSGRHEKTTRYSKARKTGLDRRCKCKQPTARQTGHYRHQKAAGYWMQVLWAMWPLLTFMFM